MDEAGKYTAEHAVMESGIEIRELKHLLEVKNDRIKELENINESHRKLNGELRLKITSLEQKIVDMKKDAKEMLNYP